MTRGNREGNNAFLEPDNAAERVDIFDYVKRQSFISNLLSSPLTTDETLLKIHRHVPGFNQLLFRNAHIAINSGHRKLAALLIGQG